MALTDEALTDEAPTDEAPTDEDGGQGRRAGDGVPQLRRAFGRCRTAVLQLSVRDAQVSSTVVGVTRPERVDKTDEMATYEVPGAPREELAASAAPEEAWLW